MKEWWGVRNANKYSVKTDIPYWERPQDWTPQSTYILHGLAKEWVCLGGTSCCSSFLKQLTCYLPQLWKNQWAYYRDLELPNFVNRACLSVKHRRRALQITSFICSEPSTGSHFSLNKSPSTSRQWPAGPSQPALLPDRTHSALLHPSQDGALLSLKQTKHTQDTRAWISADCSFHLECSFSSCPQKWLPHFSL